MPPLSDQGIRHGTEWAYVGHHCRCKVCRAAARAERQKRRAAEPREQLRAKWREEKRRQRDRAAGRPKAGTGTPFDQLVGPE